VKGLEVRRHRGERDWWFVVDKEGTTIAKIYGKDFLQFINSYSKLADACLGGMNLMLLLQDALDSLQKCKSAIEQGALKFKRALDGAQEPIKMSPEDESLVS
jgi:hypothetical protein